MGRENARVKLAIGLETGGEGGKEGVSIKQEVNKH